MVVSENSLASYLQGTMPITVRLQKAEQAFFAQLNYPPQLKEDVVLRWLFDMVANSKKRKLKHDEGGKSKRIKKGNKKPRVRGETEESQVIGFKGDESKGESLMYPETEAADEVITNGDYIEIWNVLTNILCSKRLKALSLQNWLCPIPSSFVENVVFVLNDSSADFAIKKCLVSIISSFRECQSLSAHVGLLSKQSAFISCSLLKIIDNHDKMDDMTFKILDFMFSETYMNLKATNNFLKTANVVFGDILLLGYQVGLKIEKQNCEIAEKIMASMKQFIDYSFLEENEKRYEKMFNVFLIDYEESGDASCQIFLQFLRKCIKCESVKVGTFLLREIVSKFRESYKSNARINLLLIQVITKLVGMSELFPKSRIRDSVKIFDTDTLINSHVSLEAIELVHEDQIQYLYFCLQSVLSEDINALKSKKAIWNWVQRIAKKFVNEETFSAESLQCIRIILKVNPEFIINNEGFVEKLLLKKKLGCKHGVYDSLLCEILSLYVQLRKFDELFEEIIKVLLREKALEQKFRVPELSLSYSDEHVFPPRFMKEFLSFINSATVPLLLNMWKVITGAFDMMFDKWNSDGVSTHTSLELCLWIASECMGASSFLDYITLAQYDESITKAMNTMGTTLLKLYEFAHQNLKSSSLLMCGVLKLCFCWAELHARLLSTDTCYLQESIYNESDIYEKREGCDFSFQIPFISSACWVKLAEDTEDDQAIKKITMQLLIQKVSIIGLNKFNNVDPDFEIENKHILLKELAKCLEIIFSSSQLECEENKDLIVHNLPLLFKYMEKSHYETLARIFVEQLTAKNKIWENFAQSIWFAENSKLQLEVFLQICQQLVEVVANIDGSKGSALESILRELTKKKGEFNKSQLIDELSGDGQSNRTKNNVLKQNKDVILNYVSILNFYPIYCLNGNFVSKVFTFLVALLNEMGGFACEGNVFDIIKLLNKLCYNPNIGETFSAREVSTLLRWICKERKLLVDKFTSENSTESFEKTFQLITSKTTKVEFENVNLQNLSLLFVKNMFRTFIRKNIGNVLEFVKDCIDKKSEESVIVPECILVIFSAMGEDWLISSASNDVLVCLISVAKYCLTLSSETTTELPIIALCLVSFTTLWAVRYKKDISKHGLDNEEICKIALKYIEYIYNNDIDFMKTLSLNFLKELSSSSKFNRVEVPLFIRVCSEISTKDSDYETRLKHLRVILSSSVPKYLKAVFNKNLALLESNSNSVLSFWLATVGSKMKTKEANGVRCNALESLISALTLKISHYESISDDSKVREEWILTVLDIFFAIVDDETSNTSVSNTALILTACSSIDYSLFHGRCFEKVFRTETKILLRLQRNHFYLVQQRITVMMSVVQFMVAAIIDKSKQERLLNSHDVKSLETVTISLEKVVESLKRFGPDVAKLGPFLIAAIVNGILKTPVHMVIKARLERMVFLLMDFSDNYGIKHLMTAMPASSLPLLRHLHDEFKENYVYKQREH